MSRFVLFGGLMVATMMVAGCDCTRIERTEVGRLMVTDTAGPGEERLRDAVFSVVEGQTRAEAVDTLTANGANCIDAVCVWSYENRVGLRDKVGFGPGYPVYCYGGGPACTEWITYEAKLGAPVINEQSQISITIDQGIDPPSVSVSPGAILFRG